MNLIFEPTNIALTPYLFFTGKGGVGKTSTASATAIALADKGSRVLLVSTDPASNLQDVFGIRLSNLPVQVEGVPNLYVANLDPETAATEYKAKVVEPYRGKLPDSVISTMEEQLSGACTVEIAAFNEFSTLLTDQELKASFDHILFDTAPTGHTLRLLQLPMAWDGFLKESTHGASCLGPLSGLESKKELYSHALQTLNDKEQTTLILVTRPDQSPLREAARASAELKATGMNKQFLVLNGMFKPQPGADQLSIQFYERQKKAIDEMPEELLTIPCYEIPLAPFNLTGLSNLRRLFQSIHTSSLSLEPIEPVSVPSLYNLIDDLSSSGVRVIFTMGKGGVGKTTIASAIAVGLVERGNRVHLSTTDPAAHLDHIIDQNENENLTISRIDPSVELEKYQAQVLSQNAESLDQDGLAYIEEDLRSPCTEEIAVFRAFADLVERSQDEIVVIDTAPTGHTLLLLDATQEYHKEIERSSGIVPDSVKHLLPRLRNTAETSVVIVTLPEATPVYEASRLYEDLKRANISVKYWAINQSFAAAEPGDPVLQSRARSEAQWISKVIEIAEGNTVIIPWQSEDIKGYSKLKTLIQSSRI